MERALQSIVPLRFAKLCGRTLLIPVARRQRVVVKREALHLPTCEIHERLSPVEVGGCAAARKLLHGVARIALDECAVASEQICVVLGAHAPAASPRLIADRQVINLPGLLVPVLPP